ncbi:ABC transporter permease [Humitalea sp. 24SJ18S-53]|uniref:ABC transporter permease n=1 Tax=Humitalea sp. 24SJ18S-53 TaxID=3422307 RepID=UPI003D672360
MAEWAPRRMKPAEIILRFAILLPMLVVLAFFFLLPLGITTANSLTGPQGFPTLAQYADVLTDEFYLEVLGRTVMIGVLTTLCTLLLGYPAALFLYFSDSRWRRVFLFIIISPLFISVIVRTYGWIVLLSPGGIIANALPEGFRIRLLKTQGAIVTGLVHIYVPYMVLSINAAMAKIDPRFLRAAATLGSPSGQIFRRIILPLSTPGIVSGCAIVFSLSMTAYSTPVLLGGAGNKTMPFLIYQQNLVLGDWQSGSALALVLLAVTAGCLLLLSLLTRRVVARVGG